MKKIYLDYAATTPVDPRVFRAMEPYFSKSFGNPGSLHSFGQEAIAAVDSARETIGKAIGADFREIIFTGSATEANNLALRGAVKESVRYQVSGIKKREKPRIIISAVEHESVRETARSLEREGAEIVEIPVDQNGVVDLKKFEASLNKRTILASIIYANNEIGTIQPVSEIAKVIGNFRKQMANSHAPLAIRHLPLLHTDAAQAFQFLDCDVRSLGVDLMTLSGHKIYGPKGIGVLYIRNIKPAPGVYTISPLIEGGGQEFGLRSGTENVPSIVGFGKAVELALYFRVREGMRQRKLRDRFWRGFAKTYPKAERTPPVSSGRSELPNILSVCVPGQTAEHLVMKFDLEGVAVSSGSACRSRGLRSSHVIEALGFSKERAGQSIRISFGRFSVERDVDLALKKIRMIA